MNIDNMITAKEAERFTGINRNTLNAALRRGAIDGLQVGQGGYPKSTGSGGRLIYANLMDRDSLIRFAKRHIDMREAGSVSKTLLSRSTTKGPLLPFKKRAYLPSAIEGVA